MKRDDLEWPVIRFHGITFALVLLISACLIYGSWAFREDMQSRYARDKARFSSISQKYLAVDEDERIIRQYYPEFITLYKQGIAGREHRLNWIEALRASSERLKLAGLTYSISPQQKYSPGFNVNLGKFALYSSTMTLNTGMLHEGDLPRLIKDLNKHVKGIFTITECRFDRPGDILDENHDAINIKANCELEWLNIKMSDGTEIKLS